LVPAANSQGPAVNSLSSGLSDIASRSGRKTVAVVDFTDLQGCVTELGRYMAEDVSVALVNNAKGFEVIDRTNLRVLMQEHKLASTGIIDSETARQLGKVAGVDALVTGTIAPLSDSVHVSAKVLDTETAKMLGGITADIPRTKTVDELLAKGVANCNAAPTPQADGSMGQTQAATPQAPPSPPAVFTGQISNTRVSITTCRRAGEWINCLGTIVNQASGRQQISFYQSYMVDNFGNQSSNSTGSGVMIGTSERRATLEPDIPMKFQVSEKGPSDRATTVSIILNYDVPGIGRGTLTLRNIPIQASR
jgi:TolB-like protein